MTGQPSVVICADDFGISDGVCSVIAELLVGGVLNATTCLTQERAWRARAGQLRDIADSRPGVSVGLHLDAPSLASASATLSAFRAQWAAFEAYFGRAPDFVDGHRHSHLFRGPRRALFQMLTETGQRPWLRQCRTSSRRINMKRLVLDPLSAALQREAASHGYAVNPGFGGLRRFDPTENMGMVWRRDIAAMISGGVLMTHPGPTNANDPISACRAQEAALLADGAVTAALASCGLTMGTARFAK